MTSFVIWDVAREGGWGAGANLRVACAGMALGLLGLMLGIPRDAAAALLGRLKSAIESPPFALGDQEVRCTISVGIAAGAATDERWDALVSTRRQGPLRSQGAGAEPGGGSAA